MNGTIKVEEATEVPRTMSSAQLRSLVAPIKKPTKILSAVNGWEIPANAKRDAILDRLAKELGFQSKNIMARVLLNEVSACPKNHFFKAVGQFTRFTRRA